MFYRDTPDKENEPTNTPARKQQVAAKTPRSLAKAKHRIGFNSKWTETRPWLYSSCETEEDENIVTVMYCKLCQKHNTIGLNGSKIWNSQGSRTLRLDKVTEHEISSQHQRALQLETQQQLGIEQAFSDGTPVTDKEFEALKSAMKCLHFLVMHNIPHTTVFKDFINFGIDELRSPILAHLSVGKNAQYTSHRVADEFLDVMVADIEDVLVSKVNRSPAYCLMTDESTDVSNRKHLVFCVKYIDTETGDVSIDYLKDVHVDNGLAETIFTETKKVFTDDLNFDGFLAFGSDGCNTMIGKKSGVTTRLKALKPELLTVHCSNHRLALAAKDSLRASLFSEKLMTPCPIFSNTIRILQTEQHLWRNCRNF